MHSGIGFLNGELVSYFVVYNLPSTEGEGEWGWGWERKRILGKEVEFLTWATTSLQHHKLESSKHGTTLWWSFILSHYHMSIFLFARPGLLGCERWEKKRDVQVYTSYRVTQSWPGSTTTGENRRLSQTGMLDKPNVLDGQISSSSWNKSGIDNWSKKLLKLRSSSSLLCPGLVICPEGDSFDGFADDGHDGLSFRACSCATSVVSSLIWLFSIAWQEEGFWTRALESLNRSSSLTFPDLGISAGGDSFNGIVDVKHDDGLSFRACSCEMSVISSLIGIFPIVSQEKGVWTRALRSGENESLTGGKKSFEVEINNPGSGSLSPSKLLKAENISELKSSWGNFESSLWPEEPSCSPSKNNQPTRSRSQTHDVIETEIETMHLEAENWRKDNSIR